MNHRLVADEVVYILDHSDAMAVLVSDRFLPMVESVRARAGKVRWWILLGSERRAWAVHLEDALAAGRPDPVEARAGRGVAAAPIYYGGARPERPGAPA